MDALDFIDGITALTHPREDLLVDLAVGRLSPAGAKAIVEHLDACHHCREAAEMLGWSSTPSRGVDVVRLRTAPHSVNAVRPANDAGQPRSAWKPVQGERLAASDQTTSPRARQDGAPDVVQLIPGATDGDVALGYLCVGAADVVVVGANDRVASVRLGKTQYSVRQGATDEPRIVENLTRTDVTAWLAGGREGGFAVLRG